MQNTKLKASALFLMLTLSSMYAQDAILTAGGKSSGEGGTSSYSIGQVVYSNNIGENGSITEGVQQPYEVSVTLGIDVTDINLEIKAYPNPTVNNLRLSVGNYRGKDLKYQLYNIVGKPLQQDKLTENDVTFIAMEHIPVGVYLLNVYSNNTTIKTFKIIKK